MVSPSVRQDGSEKSAREKKPTEKLPNKAQTHSDQACHSEFCFHLLTNESMVTTSQILIYFFLSCYHRKKKNLFILTCQGTLAAGRCGTGDLHPVTSFALINTYVILLAKRGLRRDDR